MELLFIIKTMLQFCFSFSLCNTFIITVIHSLCNTCYPAWHI